MSRCYYNVFVRVTRRVLFTISAYIIFEYIILKIFEKTVGKKTTIRGKSQLFAGGARCLCENIARDFRAYATGEKKTGDYENDY